MTQQKNSREGGTWFVFGWLLVALGILVVAAVLVLMLEREQTPMNSALAVGTEVAIQTCGPLESLEDLKKEISDAIMSYHTNLMNGGIDNHETSRVRNLVVRARDCHGITSPSEVGVSEEFWKNIARDLKEIPRREKP